MEKNWLIRTKSNHILGPISREKVVELRSNGSIRPDDEICQGNGYWLFLRETELVDRFLIAQEPQGFNPICEAKDVLGSLEAAGSSPEHAFNDDITLITRPISLPPLPAQEPGPPAASVVLPMPERKTPPPPTPTASPSAPIPAPVQPGRSAKETGTARPAMARPIPPAPTPVKERRWINDKILLWGSIVLLILMAVLLYYRKRFLAEFMQSSISLVLPAAHAQDDGPIKKKASFRPSQAMTTTISN